MQILSTSRLCLAASFLALSVGISGPAFADEAATLKNLQEQINALQKQLAELQAAQAKSAKAASSEKAEASTASTQAAASKDSLRGVIRAKTGVDLTLGGNIDAATFYRSKNQSADVGSNFNTMIPFNNAANAHQGEYRGSARSSKLSLKATGNPDADTKLTGYFEIDFQSAGSTSTQTQTNSYVPRMRQGFLSYEDSAEGFQLLGGQTWSLLTMNTQGIDAFKQSIPPVLDSGYLPGFNFTRAPQLRIVKDFMDKKLAVGLSVESPQAVTGGICTSTSAMSNNPSAGSSACTGFDTSYRVSNAGYTGNLQGNITTDVAPDIIVKVAYDPGWGHYEAFGITRFFHGMVGSNYHNNYYVGSGVGAGALLPVVAKKLDVQANVMVGQGVGRYGAAQLPDFSISPNGSLKPLSQYTAMLGLVAHPTPVLDTFLYAGLEQTFRHSANGVTNNAYGYGNFGVDNSGCNTVGGTCYAQTSSVWQITPGAWYSFYDGEYGKMKAGVQYSWTRRNAFSDSNGIAPHGIENIAMFMLRFQPF